MIFTCKILSNVKADILNWENNGKQEREKSDLHYHLLGKWTSVMLNEIWSLEIPSESQQQALLFKSKNRFQAQFNFLFFLFRKGIYRRRENNPLINYKPWRLRIPDVILDQTRMALCWRKNAVKTFLWVDFMLSRSILFSDWWIHACQKLWWQTS